MRSQLFRLAEVAEHPKTTVQVIRTGGAHAGLLAHFVIADLDGKPSMVYLETAAHGQVTDSLRWSLMSLSRSIDSAQRQSRGQHLAT